jgi:ribosomal protein L40E
VSVVVSPANPAANGAAVESVALSSGRPLDRRMPTQPYTRGADESVTCPQCQSGNDTDARYCDQCGTALMPTTPYQRKSDETQMCESCSCWNAPDAKVCDQCGRSLVNDHDADDGYYARRRPERRDSDEIMDTSSAPDYNPGGHSDSSIQCPHPDCTVEGGAMNAQDARFCDQCGGPLYDEDGLIVLDDSGVAEEVVEGSVGDSSALSLHRARLEMLRLR